MTRLLFFIGLLTTTLAVQAGDFASDLGEIQHAWAHANYEVSGEAARERAFEALEKRAAALKERYPGRAEALVWEGIVLSTYAGVKGGLGALGLAKRARADYQAAIELDDTVLAGSAHTSLGVLYYKVPGWPLGFGSDEKAETHLRRALEINPNGIDPNYFYADYLFSEREDYDAAKKYAERALAANDRPGRPVADAGRRGEIRRLLEKISEAARE